MLYFYEISWQAWRNRRPSGHIATPLDR